MDASGHLDVLDLPRSPRSRDARAEGDKGVRTSPEQQPRRWWFSFDGWHNSTAEDEFVLA